MIHASSFSDHDWFLLGFEFSHASNIKQLLDEVFGDIQYNQGRGNVYQDLHYSGYYEQPHQIIM